MNYQSAMTNSSVDGAVSSRRIAVVLFNLGGPDRPEAVRPFLYNLFADKSILRLPNPFRAMLAALISRKRTPEATEIYEKLGGGSPLLPNTEAQASALEASLAAEGMVRVFIAMRYWHPMSDETARAVLDFDPETIILLPLYPQYSTTTTASSLRVWREAAARIGLDVPTRLVCCYPTDAGFISGCAELIQPAYEKAQAYGRPRVLFSAHGLPEKIVRSGDPYQWQCERTSEAIVDALGIPDLDWASCYQSRVGPLKWIGPSTDEEVDRAAGDGVPLLVVPIAFVSEHSETLVEIGMQYREQAEAGGVPFFASVPTVGTVEPFVDGLAGLVRDALERPVEIASMTGMRLCPDSWAGCPCQVGDGDGRPGN